MRSGVKGLGSMTTWPALRLALAVEVAEQWTRAGKSVWWRLPTLLGDLRE